MKNSWLLIWNVILTAVVAFLLFKQFGTNNDMKPQVAISDSTAISPANNTTSLRVAYVDLDTLEKNYELFAQKKKELEVKEQQSQNLLDRKMKEFQADYTAAQEKAATMTQQQLEATQNDLQKKQADIQQLQTALTDDFQNQLNEFNGQLKDSLDSYLATLHASDPYTYVISKAEGGAILFAEPQNDITDEVVKGLNERMKKPETKK